jgi:hypothetical protein
MERRGVVLLTCPAIDLLRVEIRRLPPFDVILARKGEDAVRGSRVASEASAATLSVQQAGIEDAVGHLQRRKREAGPSHLLFQELFTSGDEPSQPISLSFPKLIGRCCSNKCHAGFFKIAVVV